MIAVLVKWCGLRSVDPWSRTQVIHRLKRTENLLSAICMSLRTTVDRGTLRTTVSQTRTIRTKLHSA